MQKNRTNTYVFVTLFTNISLIALVPLIVSHRTFSITYVSLLHASLVKTFQVFFSKLRLRFLGNVCGGEDDVSNQVAMESRACQNYRRARGVCSHPSLASLASLSGIPALRRPGVRPVVPVVQSGIVMSGQGVRVWP